ncbi:hypothetical protein [Lihuaxuella thermophila]|uniref:Uncharacterized protein n=1 Tax=Lihuaxuella thermophila TaxID=1173111 RepID=A0A1H8CIU8_9BACL|nr:hypothetical protein [Lihuaxuella thermophila]SEM94198.1 hypothetical protein SAMN05444955_103291 [Lihuaxuella thermophila]
MNLAEVGKRLGTWAGCMVMILALMLSGCTTSSVSNDLATMSPQEEAKIKEAAVQYMKETYQKDFVVTEIIKGDEFTGTYFIQGYAKDGRKTPVLILGTSPKDFNDSYADEFWSNELKPHMKKIASKTMDLRKLESMTYGYKDPKAKPKYTGDLPSVFELLKKGDKDLSLDVVLEIYQHGGREKEDIARFLNELKKMNFNEVIMEIFVYDDQLKSAPKDEDPGKHLLVRYNISGDVQTIDPTRLDPYKTVIKESK